MFARSFLLFLFVSEMVLIAVSTDCDFAGEECIDDENCCGGCCIGGTCIDTYRSCLDPYDVCKDHSCIGDENCFVYVPPECPGCEPYPVCRDVEIIEDPFFE